MNIEISKERMLEMAKKLASMDFCPEQRVFYKNILRMVKADTEGRLLVLPCKVGDTVYEIIEEIVPNRYFYIISYLLPKNKDGPACSLFTFQETRNILPISLCVDGSGRI